MTMTMTIPCFATDRRRTLARLLFACPLASQLGACSTRHIRSGDFLVPDSQLAARQRPVPGRDLAALRERRPGQLLEEREFATGDGVLLRGVVYRHPAAQATVLLYGNNAFRVAQQGQVLLAALAGLPLNVVQLDYRGYGRSEGQPTAATIQADALLAYDQVRREFPGPLIVHGHSFGSFVASYVASARQPDALVLEGTSPSAEDFIHGMPPWYARPFVRFEIEDSLKDFDNRAHLQHFAGRLLILAGRQDRVTTPAQGLRLYAAAPSRHKQICLVEAADHMGIMKTPAATAAYAALLRQLPGAAPR
jgi:pimeloyl-ACP methyl ester carboxylesterase